MTFWQLLFVVGTFGLLAFGIYAQMQRLKLPVRFASIDELNAVADVARWARQRFERGDPRQKGIIGTWWYLSRFSITRIGARISAQELVLLAPFIDEAIAGKGPPLNLPAEYEDDRPARLGAFKARMQNEGLWPSASPAARSHLSPSP